MLRLARYPALPVSGGDRVDMFYGSTLTFKFEQEIGWLGMLGAGFKCSPVLTADGAAR